MKKCCIVLIIILGFLKLVFCSELNNESDHSTSTCPFSPYMPSVARRKRSNLDYTRWHADAEPSPEFIVKVLDEDSPTSVVGPVSPPKLEPREPRLAREQSKVLKPVAAVEPSAEATMADAHAFYTRFVPPTTIIIGPTSREGELFLSPVTPEVVFQEVKKPSVSNVKPSSAAKVASRDESPPSGPQFLPHSAEYARQYAPIAPVAFARQSTSPPLTPAYHLFRKHTRTVPLPDNYIPTRTVKHDVAYLHNVFPDEETTATEAITSIQEGFGQINKVAFSNREHDLESESGIFPRASVQSTFHTITVKPGEYTTVAKDISHNKDTYDAVKKFLQKEINSDKDHDRPAEKEAEYNNMLFESDYDNKDASKSLKDTENYEDRKHDDQDLFGREDVVDNEIDPKTIADDYREDDEKNTPTESNLKNSPKMRVFNPEPEPDEQRKPEPAIENRKMPLTCNLLRLRQLNFNSPRTLPEIVAQLKQWAEESPLARWVDITSGNLTTMENPIHMMIVDDPSSGQVVSSKQTVMIIAGIRGRDHHAVAAAMYVLYQLIERNDAHADLLSKYRFWVIPVFNPDGYDYSMTLPLRRNWTKNLRQNWDLCKGRQSCVDCATRGIRCTLQPCYGVNLDRNFEYQWISAEELKSEHPCGELYAGTRQLSEPETRALTHYLHAIRTPINTFIAFKEGDVLGVMYPYSHTRKKRAFDQIYRQRAARAAAAAYSISGRPYVAGQTSEFLPLYAGGIEDWVDGHLGIDNTYSVMIFRPTDKYNTKLITERVVHEAYAAMDTLLLQSVQPINVPTITLSKSKGTQLQPVIIALVSGFIMATYLFKKTKSAQR